MTRSIPAWLIEGKTKKEVVKKMNELTAPDYVGGKWHVWTHATKYKSGGWYAIVISSQLEVPNE